MRLLKEKERLLTRFGIGDSKYIVVPNFKCLEILQALLGVSNPGQEESLITQIQLVTGHSGSVEGCGTVGDGQCWAGEENQPS